MKALSAALILSVGPILAAADTLTFDGLFEQVSAQREAVDDPEDGIAGRFAEGAYVIDYGADEMTFWLDGWAPGLLGIHDGRNCGGCGSQFDHTRISRADGGRFDVERLTVERALTSTFFFYSLTDFSGADFSLHPTWQSLDDVDRIDPDQIAGQFPQAGLGHEAARRFLDTVAFPVYEELGPSYPAVQLIGEKADGTETVVRIDPYRNSRFIGYFPSQTEIFNRTDFGDGLTDLVALRLLVDPTEYFDMLRARLFDQVPVFSRPPDETTRLYRDGAVFGWWSYADQTQRNDQLVVWFSDMTLASPAPIPLPAAGWLLLAGLGCLAVLRRRV